MLAITFQSEGAWIEAAIAELEAAADAARAGGRDSLALCLAGGSTPETVYRAMAARVFVGLRVDLWPGDERVVPATDPARNGAMIARAFGGCVWSPLPRLRLWPEAESEAEAPAACTRYEAELRSVLGNEPRFDLALLGLGLDGHTASLFPGFDPEAHSGRLAHPSISPLPPFPRMTLALGLLKAARRRVFLVRGKDKAEALRRLEAGDPSIPASLLAGAGDLVLHFPD
jgi:6-phosphogluconolactonase